MYQTPHSWGFLFVGWWLDLDMCRCISLLLFIGLAWGQSSSDLSNEAIRAHTKKLLMQIEDVNH